MQFKDKIILITGAGSGIGRAAAIAFAKEGGTIIVSDINEKSGRKTVALIESEGGSGFFIQTNVADYEQVKALMAEIVDRFERLDIAVNNAGISGELARTAEASLENWDKVLLVNTTSVFYCMKLEIQQMLKQGGGVILNTASIAGLRGLPNSIAYTASKHAVVGMTKTAALEYARNNIRINAICPVFTVTALFNPEAFDQVKPGISEKLKAQIPMKRFSNTEEVAQSILFLCSDQSTFMTGHALPLDGGLTA